jgi:hypothetical protein
MSAQILQFPLSHIRVCKWVNGSLIYRVMAGNANNVPSGWSLVMTRVHSHKGMTA